MIKQFETVPRNDERSYKSVINSFLKTGYQINTVQIHDAVANETFLTWTFGNN